MFEEPRRSVRKRGLGGSNDMFLYGDILEEKVLEETRILSEVVASRDEEFLASVLLMIKKEEVSNSTEDSSKIERLEMMSQSCDEHSWKHVVCPPNCPSRKLERLTKFQNEEDNSQLDGEPGSSSVDEENGTRYLSDTAYSSDEVFDDMNKRTKAAKIHARPFLPLNGGKPSHAKRTCGRIVPEPNHFTQSPKSSRGAKRKTDMYAQDNQDLRVQPKRKYSKQRKMIRGIEMFWNSPTESYGLAKPKNPEQYEQVVKWALSQLPKRSGTIEEVLSLIKGYGWPELKKGNTREALICKNTVTKILSDHFVERSVNHNGETIFSVLDQEGETKELDEHQPIVEEGLSKTRTCSEHQPEDDQCLPSYPVKNTGVVLRRRDYLESEDRVNEKSKKAKRELRKRTSLLPGPEVLEEAWWPEEAEDDSLSLRSQDSSPVPSRKKQSNLPKKSLSNAASAGRGRRWVRFACEKHRREHARCPDNCLMRKKSYIEDDTNDDMEVESPILLHEDSRSLGEEEVILEEIDA